MRRAAVSIPSNIAEGKGRRTNADFARFLGNARGSANELDTTLDLAEMCGLIHGKELAAARSLLDEVSRMLTTMMRRFTPL